MRIEFEVPVDGHTQVLVVGGGPAGIGVAVAAARAGATTMLVERYGFLGGMATAGMVGPFMSSYSGDGRTRLIGGVFAELVKRMADSGGAIDPAQTVLGSPESSWYEYGHAHVTPFNSEALKVAAADMVLRSGATLRLHTTFVHPLTEGTRLRGAVVHGKSGLRAVTADVVVDCSADADVAYRAGAPTEKGRAQDGLMQPMTMFFEVGNVEGEALIAHLQTHPEDWQPLFSRLVQEAQAKGEWTFPRDRVNVYRSVDPRVWRVNTTRLAGLDGTDPTDLTRAEVEGRRQVTEVMSFLRKYIPGFAHATLLSTGAQVGIRETRRVVGEYMLTAEDLASGRHFEDVIALAGYPIDIHAPEGTKPGGLLQTAPVYEIPYRSLVPKTVDQLLVAGRCLSATHEAAGAIRVMATCFATGQAAGVAAALSALLELSPRNLDAERVQWILLQQEAILALA